MLLLRLFAFIVIFCSYSFALSDERSLVEANRLMKTNSKSNHFRAYNYYKNIYLKASVSQNKKLEIPALKGIVKSGHRLHIDVSKYEYRLSKTKYFKSATKPRNKKIKRKIKLSTSTKLKSAIWRDGRLVLRFNKKLLSRDVNYFSLYDKKTKLYKYVFDIHAAISMGSQRLKKDGIKTIKLAQYNSAITRLVIQNPTKVKVSFKKTYNELIIKLTPLKKHSYSKKHTYKKTVKYTHTQYIPPLRADRNKIIVIDPGHGGKDPGAIGYRGYKEKIAVLAIAKELRRILKLRGYKVYMTRDRDIFIKLKNRTKYANKKGADLFVSIHANSVSKKQASKAYGIECYFLSPSRSSRATSVAKKENSVDVSDMKEYEQATFLSFLNRHKIVASNKLAIDLQRGILNSLRKKYKDVVDAGVREGPFWVLVGAQMPAVLVEVGFISNPDEAKRLFDRKYQKQLALGMANGIERYFANN